MKRKKVSELVQLYTDSIQEDREVYSEMRSNILLVAGEHYSKRSMDKFFTNLRNTKDMTDTQRLRLTKNHMQKISHHYEEAIMSQAPGVRVFPQIDSELQDRKAAELNQAVWEHQKYKWKFRERVREWCKSYVELGEVAVKIFWDPYKGDLLGYAAKETAEVEEDPNEEMDLSESDSEEKNEQDPKSGDAYGEDVGGPAAEAKEPEADLDQPIFSGELVAESIHAFNIFRAPGAKSMDESSFIGLRKMTDMKDLKEKYENDPDKIRYIQESSKEEYVVFDSSRGNYRRTKDQCLLLEFYFKPCIEYPSGYFIIMTMNGILEEGELPFGIFPIVWRPFDDYPTRPRGYSIIKRVRPYQAELNRASSQQATHQVTLADDKIIYQAGTKLAPGALLPGVRGLTFQGMAPTVLPGRTGEQFTGYIQSTIDEMYSVAEFPELVEDAPKDVQTDPWAQLYRSIRQKKKFARYGERFEGFLTEVCHTTLELLKKYLPDDALIQMIGKKEQVNIPEFKATTPLDYQIKLEAMDDTLETQMGKQLSISHILQYVGNQLPQEAIGKLMRNLPFGNMEDSFDEFTIDFDNVTNDMLAMERGENPPFIEMGDHKYYIKMLTARTKKADFRFLAPQVQQLYQQRIQMHMQADAAEEQKILALKNQMIPTNGTMVGVDLWVEDKNNPQAAPKRARIPSAAVEWLVQTMEQQGNTLEKMEKMDQSNLSNIASMLLSSPGAQASAGGMNGNGQPNPNVGTVPGR